MVNRFVGPKEWRPTGWPRLESSLLSEAENVRLRKLIRASKKGPLPSEDCSWLCEVVQRLAFLRPDDFDFPTYLGLVNQAISKAYATRYKESVSWSNVVRWIPGEPVSHEVFRRDSSDHPCDATLVVRPYIRLHEPCSIESVEIFRRLSINLDVESAAVINAGPMEEHLIGPNGEIYRKNLWKVRHLADHLFLACSLTKELHVDASEKIGIFCANGSDVRMDINYIPSDLTEEITFTAGLVAARYTTKS